MAAEAAPQPEAAPPSGHTPAQATATTPAEGGTIADPVASLSTATAAVVAAAPLAATLGAATLAATVAAATAAGLGAEPFGAGGPALPASDPEAGTPKGDDAA